MMRCLRRFAAMLFGMLLLIAWMTGCAGRSDLREVRIAYRTSDNTDGAVFSYETYKIAASDGERLCSLVLQLAITDPEDEMMTSVFPKKTAVRSVEISERGIITVDFSKEYASLSGIARTLADYCTVLTLFELERVEDTPISGVIVLADGVGDRIILTPDDVIGSTDYMRLRDYEFQIYFPDREAGVLRTDTFTRTLSDAERPAEVIVSILMEGRESDGGINHVVSAGTKFLGLTIRNRVCYLDFDEDFLELAILGRDEQSLKLYAFVNSLCGLSYIDRVQFLINGEVTHSVLYERFDEPYSPNAGLIA